MAVKLNISEMSDELIGKIVTDLSIVPYDKRIEDLKKRGQHVNSNPKEPIDVRVINKECGTINIPYFYAKQLLNNTKINFKDTHTKVFTDEIEFNTDLRDYQYSIIEEALQHLKDYHTTTLSLPPGYGKTIMGMFLAYVKRYLTLILIHRDLIAEGWFETIRICFPNLMDKIWYVGEKNSAWTPKKFPGEYPFFIICMKGRSHYIPQYILEKIGTLIVDEAHLFCTKDSIDALLVCTPKYVILETATLKREADKMERIMYKIAGEHEIFRIDTRPYVMYVINTYVLGVEEKNGMGSLDAGKLYKSLSDNEYRNSIILNILLTNPTHKFMILSKYVSHVEALCKMCDDEGLENASLCGSNKKYSDSFVLIGTTPKMGTGFDESKACVDFKGITSDVLIICHSTPSPALFIQMKGRVMRNKSPIIIWLNDRNNMVKGHFSKLKTTIEETNGTVIKMDYSPGEIKLPKIKKSRIKI